MNLCNAAVLAFVLAQPVIPPAPPPLRLTAAEDTALRALVAQWRPKLPVASSPVVVTVESFLYLPQFEAALRLELLRHGVDMTTAEALLASIRARNAEPHSIEAPSLAATTRIRFIDVLLKGMDKRTLNDPSLQNLGGVLAFAVPGTSGDLGLVFYNAGPQMLNTMFKGAHAALVRGGRVEWDQEFWKYPPVSQVPQKVAKLADDTAAVARALLDRHFPDRGKPLLLVNETMSEPLFLLQPELGRPVTMVLRERLFSHEPNLGNAAAVVQLDIPVIRGDTATIGYEEFLPTTVRRDGKATLTRSASGWSVTADEPRTLSFHAPASDAPLRVGGDVKPPRVVKRVRPQFPPGTRMVFAELTVSATGKITNIAFLTSPTAEVQRLAREALGQWVLEPGTLNGKPVAVLWNVVLP